MTRAADMANPPKPQQQSHGDNESLGIASTEIFRSNSELKRKLMGLVNLIPDEDDCETKVFDEISCILATRKSQKLRFQNDKSVTNNVKITQSDKSVTSSVTIKQSDKSVTSRVPITPKGKKYIAKLMDALSDHQSQLREAAKKLRLVTMKWRQSRRYIGGADIIPTLIPLLSPDLETQEHVVTTLLNLSIDKENRSLIAEERGIPPIVKVLRSENMATRENAAKALSLLSRVDEIKAQIGACDAIPRLVELLKDGNGQGKDAAAALHSLCMYHPDNKGRSVSAGLVPVLLDFIRPGEAEEDLYLKILCNLSKIEEGLKAIGDANALPLLMECIKAEGCSCNKENAVRILWALCSNDTRYLEEVKNSDGGAGFKQALTDLALTGSSQATRRARRLIERITSGPPVRERRKEMAMADGTFTLGFIGAGKMSEAIARGLDKSGILPSSRMWTAHAPLPRREAFASFGVTVMESNSKVVEECEVIVLGVEPEVVKEVLIDLKPILSDAELLVSIAAGVKLKDLEEWAGKARVVRVMPNTPFLVGESAAVMSLGEKATAEDEKLVKGLFEAVGKIWTVQEKLLDAITGLSGSGPAYMYLAIEALANGGVAAGLPQELASSLASQTVLGAAKMVIDTKKSPGQLKDEELSPAGTTIAGIHELEKGGFRATLMNAVIAAAKRSEELSKT